MQITHPTLNRSQSIVLWFAALLISLMSLYPPWKGELHNGAGDFSRYIGYSFFLEPPRGKGQAIKAGSGLFEKTIAEHPEWIEVSRRLQATGYTGCFRCARRSRPCVHPSRGSRFKRPNEELSGTEWHRVSSSRVEA